MLNFIDVRFIIHLYFVIIRYSYILVRKSVRFSLSILEYLLQWLTKKRKLLILREFFKVDLLKVNYS